jgi:hypothetical protein
MAVTKESLYMISSEAEVGANFISLLWIQIGFGRCWIRIRIQESKKDSRKQRYFMF